MADKESKSPIEKAILEYKQIVEVAKNKVSNNHSDEINAMITKLINENDQSQYNESDMVNDESQNNGMNTQESANAGKHETINMKDSTLKEIEEAFDAASDDDEFQVVKSDDNNNDQFSLTDIESEINEVMSEIEAAENLENGEEIAPEEEEEDNLTKIKKIYEEMGKMIEAMDSEKNDMAMKEEFHSKMMETFGEGYEDKIGMNECGKMYETYKEKSKMNEVKSNVPNTFSPNSAAKPAKKMGIKESINEDPVNLAAVAAGLAGVVGSGVGVAGLMQFLKNKYPDAYNALSQAGSAAKAGINRMQGIEESLNEDPVNLAAVAAGVAGIVGSGVGITGLMQYLKTKYPDAYNVLSQAGSAAKAGINKMQGIEETYGIGLSANKLVNGNQAPQTDYKEYAKDKVRSALQKESVEKLQKRINHLVNENFTLNKESNKNKNLVKEFSKLNESYKEAIDKYRKQLNEMAIVSTNIANVNNILIKENLVLSFEDKKNIINEFKKINSIDESEKTYKKLVKEFTENKKTIIESVEEKLNNAIGTSASEEVNNAVEKPTLNEHVEKIKKLSTYKSKN